MDAQSRQHEILSLLNQQDRVEVETLSALFSVSSQTIRTDLRELSDRGLLSRVHGGAVRVGNAETRAYADRRKHNAEGKSAMAQAAADLIPDNCSITLNIGTSTEHVARALSAHRDLTVISNNINIINIMMGGRSKDLILMGGAVRQSDGAIVGEEAVDFISRYKTDFAIIGASALDPDGAIMDHDLREVSVARAILRNARTRILVADGSKFLRSAPVRICALDDLDIVITDRPVPEEFAEAAQRCGTRVLIAQQNESHEND
ncbi:MAG: DeoR/GlpR family DNA-binding transcription regulator [Rhodobacteraceae bacterium]|jgi:DeoR family glycerol-3-phosphate regulon repressor|nr:DeoR/GlpR family DNA-binding transcription regulator [Paracoccaceae bacterium]